jgi:hypothetical protein
MPFYRRNRISPDFIAVPAEPPMRGIGERRQTLLALIDEELRDAQAAGNQEAIDELLEARSAVMKLARGSAPVSPGRSS